MGIRAPSVAAKLKARKSSVLEDLRVFYALESDQISACMLRDLVVQGRFYMTQSFCPHKRVMPLIDLHRVSKKI